LSRAASALAPENGYAHVFYEDREDLRITAGSRVGTGVVQTRQSGLAVRTGRPPGRMAALADPAPEDAELLVRRAPARPRLAGSQAESPPRLDPGPGLTTLLDLVERAAAGYPADVEVHGSWVEFDQWVVVARPGPPARSDRRCGTRLRLEMRRSAGGREATAVAERIVRTGERLDPETLALELGRRATERLQAIPASPGEYPVVFDSGVGGLVIHEIVGHALEADCVQRGASILVGEKEIAPAGVTVIDDPVRGRGGWRVDDEGEDALETALLVEGRLQGVLHDQGSARISGTTSNGHGRRSSFRESVRPRMGCTFLGAGYADRSDVLSGVRRGLLVRRMETASFDPRSGDALFRVTDADRIEGGRADAPLHPFLLRVGALTALSTLGPVGRDLSFDRCIGSCLRDGQPLPTSVGAPTFRIGMATVVAF
jgi:predicted Zn-dependent protease